MMAGSWSVFLEKKYRGEEMSPSKQESELHEIQTFWVSHSFISKSIKQISCVGSMQFSCYSGTRCCDNALKCMLTVGNIIMRGSTKYECICIMHEFHP